MTNELKTLKDLTKFYSEMTGEWMPITSELRQEAIKWVKHMQSGKIYEQRWGLHVYDKWFDNQITYFLQFFNITEEDLK